MSIRSLSLTFVVICIVGFTTVNCAVKPKATTLPALKAYVSYDLNYADYRELFLKLELALGKKLKSRGEAHITVVTPPEFAQLKTVVSPERIHAIAATYLDKPVRFQRVCLGQGTKKINATDEYAYFIVVTSPDLLKLRRALAGEGHFSKKEFDPELFFSHITLGFTERDLYFEDGLIKDEKSCPADLQKLLVAK